MEKTLEGEYVHPQKGERSRTNLNSPIQLI